jgi:hypothetical protein
MDYAFVPGSDSQAGNVRMMLARRTQTTTIAAQRRRTTVQQFINHLNTTASITKPIGNLLLGAHANSEGEIFITMFTGQRGGTTWDVLEQSLNTAANSIAIPDTLIGFTAPPPTAFLHFKGCNAGKQRPFLVKLKEALGDHVNVTAPKHFHDIFFDTRYGVWESMAYEFRLQRPQASAFTTVPGARAAFHGASLTLINGTAIPRENWDTWIPDTVNVSRSSRWNVPANIGSGFGRRTTADTTQEFRVDPTTFHVVITSSATDDAQRKADLQADLAGRTRFQSTHSFPMYQELGYASLSSFVNGYTWKFTASGSSLDCLGSRIIYTSVIPIRDPADALNGNLIFNFYPNAGSTIPSVTTTLQESDATYFESV